MRIGLTYDRSAAVIEGDHDARTATMMAARETIESVCDALCAAGHTVVRLGSATDLIDRLAAGERVDLVFNMCTGGQHRLGNAQVPSILDTYNIPYTFSNPLSMCVCEQPDTMHSLLREHGVPTCDRTSDSVDADYVVAIMGNGAEAETLGASTSDTTNHGSRTTCELAQRTALAAWRTLDCCDAGCVYLRVDADGRAQVVRVQPMPSFDADQSDMIKIADSRGITLERLVNDIVNCASQRIAQANSQGTVAKPPKPHLMTTQSRQRAT